MIQKLKSVIVLAALSLVSPVALSQDSTPELDRLAEIINLPKQIRVQVELIEMSHEELTNLMTKPRAGANDQDLRDACTKLVEQNKATILETTSVIARSGQRSSTESITEFTYPTEWEPYELPNQLEAPEYDDGPKALELIPQPTPTEFETRNLGTTLEVVIGAGRGDGVDRVYCAGTGSGVVEFTWTGSAWVESRIKRKEVDGLAIGDARNDGIVRLYAGSGEYKFIADKREN